MRNFAKFCATGLYVGGLLLLLGGEHTEVAMLYGFLAGIALAISTVEWEK